MWDTHMWVLQHLLRSGDACLLFTSSYSPSISSSATSPNSSLFSSSGVITTFDFSLFNSFICSHGLGIRAIAIEVEDAGAAFHISVANGAKPSSSPIRLRKEVNTVVLSEVHLFGDIVLRYISYDNKTNSPNPGDWFLPGFAAVEEESSFPGLDYGIRRLDHALGSVPELGPVVEYIKNFTGFHEFAEFTTEEVGTSESGLNTVVLTNNDETVLIPVSEPVHGTKRKSQIQMFLEHNDGVGVHHLALMTEDIFWTLREMRKWSTLGGFEFVKPPPPTYYSNLKIRVGDVLTTEQIKECEEMGILVDKDDRGTLLQIFTKPIGDRPTMYIEIIQRIGCMVKDDAGKLYQKASCGGFEKGNFAELYKSIEEYAKTLEPKPVASSGPIILDKFI